MFGEILFFLITIILGALSVLMAVLAWRTKSDILFYLGAGFCGVLLILMVVNFDYYWHGLMNPDQDPTTILMLVFLGLSVYFLISSKLKTDGYNDITDAGITELINETASSDEEYDPTDGDYLDGIIEKEEDEDEYTVK